MNCPKCKKKMVLDEREGWESEWVCEMECCRDGHGLPFYIPVSQVEVMA